MNIIWNDNDYLMHYGMPRRSGRYKWGSGKNPYHHGADSPRKKYKKALKTAKANYKSRLKTDLKPGMSTKKLGSTADKLYNDWKNEKKQIKEAYKIGKSINEQRKELSKYKQAYNKKQQKNIKLKDKDKDFIHKTANSKLLYKYRDQFDDKELRLALNRINTEKDLREVRNKDINRGKRILYKKIMSTMVPLSKEVETTVSTLNRFEKGVNYAKKHLDRR